MTTTNPRGRDGFLCFCNEVTAETFSEALWAEPNLTFEEACLKTLVGNRCTACVLNAEELYGQALEERRPVTPRRSGIGVINKDQTPLLRRLYAHRFAAYDFVDALTPRLPVPQIGVAPILAGPGISTTVNVTNSISGVLGPRSPSFVVMYECRDKDGTIIHRGGEEIAAGERMDHLVSDRLTGTAECDDLLHGSCRLTVTPKSHGFRGTTRPHFWIRSPHATSALHTQGGRRDDRYFVTDFVYENEKQYLSVVNIAAESGDLTMIIRGDDGARCNKTASSLPSMGARLIELQRPADPKGLYTVEVRASVATHSHIVVRDLTTDAISFDHL